MLQYFYLGDLQIHFTNIISTAGYYTWLKIMNFINLLSFSLDCIWQRYVGFSLLHLTRFPSAFDETCQEYAFGVITYMSISRPVTHLYKTIEECFMFLAFNFVGKTCVHVKSWRLYTCCLSWILQIWLCGFQSFSQILFKEMNEKSFISLSE